MKKLFTLFLALVATSALWAQRFQVGELYYNITSSSAPYTVEVTYEKYNSYYNYSSLTTATIPETVNYNGTTYSVTSIGSDAFRYCRSLTSVTIPNSVTSIGDYPFSGCSSLPIENNLRYADTYLVEAVDKTLSTYSIKEGTKWIGTSAFSGCSSLTSITIPNSVTSIGERAFAWCESLTSVTIPNSVTSIGDYPFSGCSSLPIENNLRYADTYLVEAVDETLSTYSIKEGTKWIGDGAFEDCSSLTSITIPNSVTSIGEHAFEMCSSLASVTIGNSVTSIGYRAFYDCYSLATITIPNSVTSIGEAAFYDCSSLASPVYNAHCFAYMPTSFKGAYVIPEGIKQIAGGAFERCRSLTSVTIPKSVTSIGGNTFNDCRSLTSVTIPNSVTSIGGAAFAYCSSLTSITIPNSVTRIGIWAFLGCSSLTSITIPNSVTSIGDRAFEDCSSLTSVTIPNSVTSIGDKAFYDCSSLTKTNYTGEIAGWCNIKFGSVYANPIYYSHNFYINDQKIKDLVIPNSITSIGDYAFYYCSSLDTITCLAMTPPALGEDVFYRCDNPTLFVPCAALSDYQLHKQWGQFTNIECISSEEAETEEVVIESGTTTIQKIMRDGQLIILRDEVEYNAMGQEL